MTCLARSLAAASLLLCLAACGRDPAERKAHYLKTAELAFNVGHYQPAARNYLRAIAVDPRDTTALAQLGRCFVHLGQLSSAEKYLAQARELNPDLPDVRLSLGTLHFVRGRLVQAYDEALYVAGKDPANLEALSLLAQSASTPRQARDAVKRLEAQAARLGKDARFHFAIGKACVRMKDWKNAERAFHNALEVAPDSMEAQLALGQLYLAKADLASAERALESATGFVLTGSEADIQMASYFLLHGQAGRARLMLEDLAAKAPAALPPQRMLAALAYDQNRYDDAEAAVDRVLERRPDDHFALLLMGRIHRARGLYDEAIARFEQLASIEPDSALPAFEIAQVHIHQRDYPAARRALGRSLQIAPDFLEARLLLAAVGLQDGSTEESIQDMLALLDQQPDSYRALEILGAAYLKAGDPQRAAESYRRMVELAPYEPRGLYLAGVAFLLGGDAAQAEGMFESALGVQLDFSPALSQLASLALGRGDAEAALARVTRQLDLVPSSAPLWMLLGRTQLAAGLGEPGEASLCEAVLRSPDLLQARRELGVRFASQGMYRQSLEMLDPVLAAQPLDHDLLILCGSLSEGSDRLWEAEARYRKALSIQPKSVVAANNLAYLIAVHGGDLTEAEKLARAATTAVPAEPRFADTLAWTLYQLGRHQEAEEPLLWAAQKLPRSGDTLCHLGLVQWKLGQRDAARSTIEKALALPIASRAGDECRQVWAEIW